MAGRGKIGRDFEMIFVDCFDVAKIAEATKASCVVDAAEVDFVTAVVNATRSDSESLKQGVVASCSSDDNPVASSSLTVNAFDQCLTFSGVAEAGSVVVEKMKTKLRLVAPDLIPFAVAEDPFDVGER